MILKIFLVLLLQKVSSSPITKIVQLDGLNEIDAPCLIENQDDVSESIINVLHVTENISEEVTPPDELINDVTSEDLQETESGTDKPFRIGISISATPMDDELSTTEKIEATTLKIDDDELSTTEKIEATTLKIDVEEETVNIWFKNDVTTDPPPQKTSTVKNVDDKPFTIEISVATNPMDDELSTTKKIEATTLKMDVEEKPVNIGFKKNVITDPPSWKTSTVRNVEVITQTIPTSQKLEGRLGDDLNLKLDSIDSEKENNPHGYPQAIFNGVFAIGRSDFAPESSTTPKPGSFGSSFLNLAKKFDARYKYKYSWSFSGVEKTTPKPPEIDGPLFNQKFFTKLTLSNEKIKLNATNLSETGLLTTKTSDYKGLNLYKPNVPTFL